MTSLSARTLFPHGKAAIAMLQLRPLPGSFRYSGEPVSSIID